MTGEVYTFGAYQKGQLGREAPVEYLGDLSADVLASHELWFAKPYPIPNVGPSFGRPATWIGASGEQTFVKLDQSLISSNSLEKSAILANKRHILLFPDQSTSQYNCLTITRSDGFCRSFAEENQENLAKKLLALDPLYGVLWSYSHESLTLKSYLPIKADISENSPMILSPDLALPVQAGCLISRNQASLNMLSCLDTLNQLPDVNLTVMEDDLSKGMTI